MESYENLTGIIKSVYQRRKSIIGITALTGIVVALLSLLLPNYYAAESTFYAASPDLAKPAATGSNELRRDYYGKSEDMDRLFSIAQSGELNGGLIKQFDLYKHYKIDPESNNAEFRINKIIDNSFTIEKSKYDAFRLSIEDKNPILSRDMTNFARDFINKKAQSLIKDSQKKLIQTYKSNIESKEVQINELNEELDSLRNKYDIFDTRSQGQVIAEKLSSVQSRFENLSSRLESYRAVSGYRDSVRVLQIAQKALNKQIELLSKQAKNYNKGLAKIVSIEKQQTEASDQLGIDKERYKSLQAAYNNEFDAIHVVEYATKPLRKSRPKRSILVLSAAFGVFILSCLIAIVSSYYKKYNWKDIFQDEK